MNFDRPIFVIGAPRSGTSILFRMLSLHNDFWHLPSESHTILEGPWHPKHRDFESNRVDADDVTQSQSYEIRSGFADRILNLNLVSSSPESMLQANGLTSRILNLAKVRGFGALSRRKLNPSDPVRLLEKTPKNSLRVAALNRVFPDARFIYLKREAAATIDSLIDGWMAVDRFGPYRRHRFSASGYEIMNRIRLSRCLSPRWKFALPPLWQTLDGADIADAAALQYFSCTNYANHDLQQVPEDRVLTFDQLDLVHDPVEVAKQCIEFAELPEETRVLNFARNLPMVNQTSKRSPNTQTLRHAADVERVMADERWTQPSILTKSVSQDGSLL